MGAYIDTVAIVVGYVFITLGGLAAMLLVISYLLDKIIKHFGFYWKLMYYYHDKAGRERVNRERAEAIRKAEQNSSAKPKSMI